MSKDWNGLWHYEEGAFIAIANAISTVLSSLMPTTSIMVLYFVKNPLARLAMTMVFTTIFSLTLATIAKARRIDVFAATTAYVTTRGFVAAHQLMTKADLGSRQFKWSSSEAQGFTIISVIIMDARSTLKCSDLELV